MAGATLQAVGLPRTSEDRVCAYPAARRWRRGALEDTLTPSLFLPQEQGNSLARSTVQRRPVPITCVCTSPARRPQPKGLVHTEVSTRTQCRKPSPPCPSTPTDPPKAQVQPRLQLPTCRPLLPDSSAPPLGCHPRHRPAQSDGCWCTLSLHYFARALDGRRLPIRDGG